MAALALACASERPPAAPALEPVALPRGHPVLPIVELTLGERPARVLLATGAPTSMVDRGFARTAKLVAASGRVEDVALELGPRRLEVAEFLQRDLSSGRHAPVEVDAVLGFDVLRRVVFMVHDRRVSIFPEDVHIQGAIDGLVPERVFVPMRFNLRTGLPIIYYDLQLPTRNFESTKLEGTVRIDLFLDTGQTMVIGLPPLLTKLLEQEPPYRLAPFTFGSWTMAEVAVTETEERAVLGMGALRPAPMVFDGPARRLWILAPPGYGEKAEPEDAAEAERPAEEPAIEELPIDITAD